MGAASLTGDGEPILASAPRVSPGLPHMFRVTPRLGRLFDRSDVGPGSRAVLISERLWTRRFGRASGIINQRLTIDDEPQVIVGVLPGGFAFPEQTADVWRPLVLGTAKSFADRATILANR